MMIRKNDYVRTPRFSNVKYEIVGKRVGTNEMEFAAYLKAGKPVMKKVVMAAEAPADEPEPENTPEPEQASTSEQASTPELKRTAAKDLDFPKLTGTPKQVKWAKDIRQQVLDAAYMIYADDVESDKDYEIAFEDTKVGHIATFAAKYMTSSKFWIDQVGYDITNWKKLDESIRSLADLEATLKRLMGKFSWYDDKECSISTRFWAEEEELKPIRSAATDAMWAAYRARKAAEKAEKERQTAETTSDESASTVADEEAAAMDEKTEDASAEEPVSTAQAELPEEAAADEDSSDPIDATAQNGSERRHKIQKIKVVYECGVPRGDTIRTASGGISSSYTRDEEGYKVWRPADYMMAVAPNTDGEQTELYAEYLADDNFQDINYDSLKTTILEQAEEKSVDPTILQFPHDDPGAQDILKDVESMEEAILEQMGSDEAFKLVSRMLDYSEKESIYHRIIEMCDIRPDEDDD